MSLVTISGLRPAASSWGTSENNRRAKFYAITRAGEKHLAAESKHWTRMVTLITALLES